MSSLKIEVEDAVLQSGLETLPVQAQPEPSLEPAKRRLAIRRASLLLLISLVAVGINGYHPYGEDAAIYVAGIKQASRPNLYGSSSAFIAPFFRLSLFSDWNAWIIRTLHLPLAYFLFGMQIATTWLLLYACWQLARRCFPPARRETDGASREAWAAVLLVAACLSIPVAGSSLFIMDPYLTGRSFSTPLTLLAICACLDEKRFLTVLLLALVALFHPLMSIYAIGFVLLLWAVKRRSWTGVAGLIIAVMCTGAVIQYSQRTVVESAAYQAAVASRYYFFLYRWQWYELLGVIAPLVLLAGSCYWLRRGASLDRIVLAKTCVLVGAISIVASLVFARPSSHSHLIAALQPIRIFLLIYLCMFLLLGGLIGRHILGRVAWRWVLLFAGTGAGIAFVQHQAYPYSAQVELPWMVSHNAWNRAFVWIRDNTPADAVVALDADYIHAPQEDAQGFRAIAERSSLADRSKDGGASAVFRQLADRWMTEQTATTNLNQIDDAERRRRLAPFHVGWMVLQAGSSTSMPCPFEDEVVKVCRLR